MSSEQPQNIEKQVGNIDITNLSYDFCNDDVISAYYQQKLLEISDKDKWLEKNKEHLSQRKDKIAKAVQDGLIANGDPETIWQFEFDRIKCKI